MRWLLYQPLHFWWIYFKIETKMQFWTFQSKACISQQGERRSWRSKGKFLTLELVFVSYANIYKITIADPQWRGHNEIKNSKDSLIAIHNLTYKLQKKKIFPITPYTFFIKLGIIIFLKVITTKWNMFSLLNIQCHLIFINTLWNNYQQNHTLGYYFKRERKTY